MSSKPHGGSVASAALLTIPPGRPIDMRQLVDEGRRDRAGCIGRLEQPRRDRDILLERDPEETWVRVGIKANKDVRVSPDGGEVPTARQLGKGAVAALEDALVPDDLLLISMNALIICVI